jgi:hypothetical protein
MEKIPRRGQSQHQSTKTKLFSDALALNRYVTEFTDGLPVEVSTKFATYVGLRAPQLWDKSSLDLLLAMCRMEAQIDALTKRYDELISQVMDESSIKLSKLIAQSTASLVTQTTALAQRLCVTHSMLHGSPTRLVTTNNAAREATALLQPNDELPSTATATSDYEEAKKMFRKNALKAEQHE